MTKVNCLLCMDRGSVTIDQPVPAIVDDIEFDYIDKIPCPVCQAGYRMQIATEAKVRLMDAEEA